MNWLFLPGEPSRCLASIGTCRRRDGGDGSLARRTPVRVHGLRRHGLEPRSRTARPVYDLLGELGIAVTKSVWVDDPGPRRTIGGSTCAEPRVPRLGARLRAAGHEIGFHNASDRSSTRAQTAAALDRFEELFGHPPRCGADHAGNAEALYAGTARLSDGGQRPTGACNGSLQPTRPRFSGEDPSSPHFWGDLCAERIAYWRRFSFARTDLTAVGPVLHHDPLRPYVNAWFNSAHGPRLEQFLERVRPERLDRLERDGGVCIIYAHFGVDFVDGRGAARSRASWRPWRPGGP